MHSSHPSRHEWLWSLVWSAWIGGLGSFATLGFRIFLTTTEHLLYGPVSGLVQAASSLPWWQRFLTPALGGALAGSVLLLSRHVTKHAPHGDYMEAVVLGRGELHVGGSLLSALASACSVVSGGAIGREGPMVQLAALTGSLTAGWRKLPVPRRRLLVACGAAAGLTTAYGTPIAGALFIAEIVLQSLATETLVPLLLASAVARINTSLLFGTEPLYHMPEIPSPQGFAFLLSGGLALLAGVGAPLFLGLLRYTKRVFQSWNTLLPLKLAVGGSLVGLLSIQTPQVWGNGFSVVNSVLQGDWTWQALVLVLVFKVIAVVATTGSGAVGGIFTPTLFVGAVSGALFSLVMDRVLPGVLPVPLGVAVGMGAFLSATTHAPLTAVLMIFEMTGNYRVVAPLMLAGVFAAAISRRLRPESVYASSQKVRVEYDPRLAVAQDLLRTDSPTVQRKDSLATVEIRLLEYRWRHIYVVDAEKRFQGAIAMHDVAGLLKEQHDLQAPWPETLLKTDYPRLSPEMPLWDILAVFDVHNGERLPVLDDSERLLGYVTKADLLLILRDRLAIA